VAPTVAELAVAATLRENPVCPAVTESDDGCVLMTGPLMPAVAAAEVAELPFVFAVMPRTCAM
jgi:hypothetical protein